jgi:hypothetical protein
MQLLDLAFSLLSGRRKSEKRKKEKKRKVDIG